VDKILNINKATKVAEDLHKLGEQIILVGGCFDILHVGHIEFLSKAKELGGQLLVILESDDSVRKLKGISKPVIKQDDRAILLSSLKMIDYIIKIPNFNNDNKYLMLVKKIKPDIIAITKGDPVKNKKIKQAVIVNAKVVEVIKRKRSYSTKKIIETILTKA